MRYAETLVYFVLLAFPYFLLVLGELDSNWLGFLNYFSLAVLFVWLIRSFVNYRLQSILLVYVQVILFVTVVVSLILEYGVFLNEVQVWTVASGLPVKASINVFLTITGAQIVIAFSEKNIIGVRPYFSELNRKFSSFARLSAIFGILILCYMAFAYGSPLFHGVHRQDYWFGYAPSWGSTVVYALIQLCFVFGVSYAYWGRRSDVVFLISVLLILVVMGVRFTGLVSALLLFATPIALLNIDRIKLVSARALLYYIALAALISFGLWIGFESYSEVGRAERIVSRVALQPQMWWALDQLSGLELKRFDEIIKSYFGIADDARDVGVYYLMYLVAPYGIVERYFETGSSFTSAGIFNNVYFFGYIVGLFVNFFWGAVLGLGFMTMLAALRARDLILTIVAFRLAYKIQAIVVSGNQSSFLGLEIFLLLLVLSFCLYYRRKSFTS